MELLKTVSLLHSAGRGKLSLHVQANSTAITENNTGPDPGFSVGGGVDPFWGGFLPPTWALFSENVCKNKRIGSCRGRAPARPPPRSAYAI